MRFVIGKDAIKGIIRVLKAGEGYFESVNDIATKEEIHRQSLSLLQEDSTAAATFGSGYGYADDIQEFDPTRMNYLQMNHGDPFKDLQSESPAVYGTTLTTFMDLFIRDKEIKSVLNFGVSYANADATLAGMYPDVKFTGIDRSQLTKTFNEIQFGDLANMEFVANDIFEYLAHERDWTGGVFFTSRTMMILPKSFVEKLYAEVRKAGFRYIVGLEPIGISRQTGHAYVFSEDDQPSIVYTHKQFIHNYPALLRKAGYTPITTELIKTANGHRDFRIIKFVGRIG